MAHYRKIDSRIQNDEKFCSLSDDGQLVFLLILTHPHLTALGAMRGSIAGLAAEKRWTEKRYRKAFTEAESLGMVKYNERASMIWLPNFLKYNHPESPNVVRSWASSLELLPECNLKRQLCLHVRDFIYDLPKTFGEALPQVFQQDLAVDFPKTMANQEQEQKQEQEENPPLLSPPLGEEPEKPKSRKAPKREKTPAPETIEPAESQVAYATKHGIDLEDATHHFLSHHRAHGTLMLDWHDGLWTWLHNANKFRATSNGARASPSSPPAVEGCIGYNRRDGLMQWCDACGRSHT